MAQIPPYLQDMQKEIEEYARSYGLDFFPVIFEMLDYKRMNEVASYGGFPNRYPHWKFGMVYEQLSKGYEYGLQKIYEMVINNVPSIAYLLEGNSLVDQKLVMAHVYGHVDFFKNNYYFSKTNRKAIDTFANHATRIRKYVDRIGIDKVENFIDCCLSLDNLIDYHAPFIVRRVPRTRSELQDPFAEEDRELQQKAPPKLKAIHSYMDRYINPPAFLEEQQKKLEAEREKPRKFPEHPERDVLLFLIEHAPLERWERDVLEIIRDEAYYFAPQGQTKIMNEGWATYWHSTIMTQKALKPAEVIDYADHHSGTVHANPMSLNPYKLGVELFRYIEDRWNKGRFGREYEECDDLAAKRSWDKRLGLGRKKIFEVRALYNDVTFIDEFFTHDFCVQEKFFNFGYNERAGQWEIETREFQKVKQRLLFSLTNFGQPIIRVEDGNHENRGELLLKHLHEGIDLKIDHARDTLQNLQRVWKRPVNLMTKVEGKGKILKFDGSAHSEKTIEYK